LILFVQQSIVSLTQSTEWIKTEKNYSSSKQTRSNFNFFISMHRYHYFT